jgi:hypothetical protein
VRIEDISIGDIVIDDGNTSDKYLCGLVIEFIEYEDLIGVLLFDKNKQVFWWKSHWISEVIK